MACSLTCLNHAGCPMILIFIMTCLIWKLEMNGIKLDQALHAHQLTMMVTQKGLHTHT